MPEEYSLELCQYVGRIELRAFQAFQSRGSFERYIVFCDALDSLSSAGLPEIEKGLAREFLRNRAGQTKPANIGSASGEAGDAD